MRENLKAIKRLVAFSLTVFMLGTTVWNDVFVIATEENNCSEYVDEQTYAANILQPVGEGDGYCDHCGHVEQSHENLEETAEEEIPVEEQHTDIITGDDGEGVDETIAAEEIDSTNPEEIITEEIAAGDEPAGDNAAENDEINTTDPLDEEETPDENIEENPEEDEEECEHDWQYTSNNDGTHTKKCSKCEEESTEECTADEEGKCIHCGYVEAVEEECEHEWVYTSNDDGTHIKKCSKCDVEEVESCQLDENGVCQLCGYEDERLTYQEFTKTIYGVRVDVKGMIPRGGTVDIFYIGTKTAENIVNDNLEEGFFKAFAAYDINIYYRNGDKYQPSWDDNSVAVTFSGVNELGETPDEEIAVYRIEQDYSVTEIEADVNGEEVSFDAEHFSVYVTGAYSDTDQGFLLMTDQDFAAVLTAGTDKAYTKVNRATFDMYVDEIQEYDFEVEVYRNLANESDPRSGSKMISHASGVKVTPERVGWNTVEIDLSEVTAGDGYIAKGKLYSIIVKHEYNEVSIGYSKTGVGSSKTYVKNGSTWSNDFDNSFYITTADDATTGIKATIETTDTPAGSFTIDSLVIDDSRAIKASDGNYYIAKMNSTDDPINVKAILSNSEVERDITWKTGANSVLSVTKNSTMEASIKAIGPGATSLTGIMDNDESTAGKSASINIVVLSFSIGGVDSVGEVASFETYYTGSEITTAIAPVKVYKDATDTPVNTGVSVSYFDNKDAGTARVEIKYTAVSPAITYTRYFKILPLDISTVKDGKNAFDDAEFAISSGTIVDVTNVNTNNALAVTPSYQEGDGDFSAAIDGLDGIKYKIIVTGKKNFTGSVEVDYISSDISKALTVELSPSSKLRSCYYNGQDYTLTEVSNGGWSELIFKNTNKVVVNNVVKSGATGNATYKIYDYVEGFSAADYSTKDVSPRTAGKKAIVVTVYSTEFTGSIFTTFTIQKADMANVTIKWTNGNDNGEFLHTGNPVEPTASPKDATSSPDFKVYLGYVSDTEYGAEVDASDFVESYPVGHTNITDNPYIKLTGAGKNFDAETYTQKYYTIIPNYDLDLVVRIGDNGTTYEGTAKENYVTGYTRYYDGSKTKPIPNGIPSLTVRLSSNLVYGTDYTYDVYDSYTDATTNTALSENVGIKYIVITPLSTGQYKDNKSVIATYEVIAKPLTDSDIANTVEWGPKAKSKTFTGQNLTWSTAVDASTMKVATAFESNIAKDWDTVSYNSDGPDLTIKYDTNYLVEGVDYTINYGSNYKNAGTVRPTITGIGNYTGALSGTAFRYTINPASLTKPETGNADAEAAIYGTPNLSYDGTPKFPDVRVTIGGTSNPTFAEVYTYTSANLSSENFTVRYDNNQSPGDATITITGKNNLTGSAIVTFPIGYNTTPYKEIWIDGKYQAGDVKETKTISNGIERYYYSASLEAYYTGSKYNKLVKIIGDDGKDLQRNKDYVYTYAETTKYIYTDTTYSNFSKDTTPYLWIQGRGDYLGNNAIVYFNIKPQSIENAVVTIDGNAVTSENSALDYDPLITDAPYPNYTVTLGGKVLVKDTDYTVTPYDTYNADTNTGDAGTKKAGVKTAIITGINNYTGFISEPFTVGIDVGSAQVAFKNPFDESDTTYWISNGNNNVVRWTNSNAPNVYLSWKSGTVEEYYYGKTDRDSAIRKTNSLRYEPTASITADGMGLYDARAPKNKAEEYNTITLTVTAEDNTQFYGTKEIKYLIKSVDIVSTITDKYKVDYNNTTKNYLYTGADITPLVSAKYIYGIDSTNTSTNLEYALGEDDYYLDPDKISETNEAGSTVKLKIYGWGNFWGEENAGFNIGKGKVKAYRINGADKQEMGVSSADVTYNLNDDTPYKLFYTYNGEPQYPTIKVTAENNEEKELVEGRDYVIEYKDDEKLTDDRVSPGDKTITITVSAESKNYSPQVITVKYSIVSKELKNYDVNLSDIPYTALENGITPNLIQTYISDKTCSLTVGSSTETLVYGTDYEIVTDASATELGKIKQQAEYTAETSIVGANSIPSYKYKDVAGVKTAVNWIYIKGKGTFSGYKKVPFTISLNLNSTYAFVSMEKPYYTLNEDNAGVVTPTEIVQPIIYYKLHNGSYDTAHPLESSFTLDGTTMYNYKITRSREGKPGPDEAITVTGQNACKNSWEKCKYYSNISGTGSVVYFKVDLKNYTKILMTSAKVRDYTGRAIEATFAGMEGAKKVQNSDTSATALDGDYRIAYTTDYESYNTTADAITVGVWYAVIVPTENSRYFVYGEDINNTSGNRYSFTIKYNLSTAKITFYDGSNVIDSTGYTGNDIKVPAIITIPGSGATASTDTIIYNYNENINKYVVLSPDPLLKMGDYTIAANPNSDYSEGKDYVYGSLVSNFKVKGIALKEENVSVTPNGLVYTGEAIRATVVVSVAGLPDLKEGTDYTVEYKNNINASTDSEKMEVIVTGINAYSGTITRKFTIAPKLITPDMISVEECHYIGETADKENETDPTVYLKLEPKVTVMNGATELVEGIDYEVLTSSSYTNNSSIATSVLNAQVANESDWVRPQVLIKAIEGGNYTSNDSSKATFTIDKLDISSTADVDVQPDYIEYTGKEQNPYDIISIKVKTGDKTSTLKEYNATEKTGDYVITVLNSAGRVTPIKAMGSYTIVITGKNSCDKERTINFTVKERSLADNYHYYFYDGQEQGTWTYSKDLFPGDTTTKIPGFETKGKMDGDSLRIKIPDVTSVTEGSDNRPDKEHLVIIDDEVEDPDDPTKKYQLVEGKDYTVSVTNATKAGTGEWSRVATSDKHAEVAASSPAITITGIGDYKDSITLPFNIGKNINTLDNFSIQYSVTGYSNVINYNPDLDNPTMDYLASHDGGAWQYKYNGFSQIPSVTVYLGTTRLAKDRAYKVTFTDLYGNEDASTTAGWKKVVVTGIGDYCGTMSQVYSINKKKIEAVTAEGKAFTNESPMQTTNGELTFSLNGAGIYRFTEETAKKYLLNQGVRTEADALKYVGYYYAIYDGKPITPDVIVKDNTLGANLNISGTISENDLDVDKNSALSYPKAEEVTKFEYNGDVLTCYPSDVVIGFANKNDAGENDFSAGGNYYVGSTTAQYHINYIIVQCDITDTFDIDFVNGLNDKEQEYDEGKFIEPRVVVRNGERTLKKDQDYEVEYKDNYAPGLATVIVSGRNNYRGEQTLEFTITADLSATSIYYYNANNEFVKSMDPYGPIQQYTGTYITEGNPKIFLVLEASNNHGDIRLTYGKEYSAPSDSDHHSDDSYVRSGEVYYRAIQNSYWTGTKRVLYDIEYDETDIKANNYESQYMFTGRDIKPKFGVSITTAKTGEITYERVELNSSGNVVSAAPTTDFISLGYIRATIPYAVGEHTGAVQAIYQIIPRPIGECKVEYEKTQRYTGREIQPAFKVLIESKDLQSGDDNTPYPVDASNYTVDYGKYISNDYSEAERAGKGRFILTGNSDIITRSSTKAYEYDIKLQSVANLRVTKNTGDTITAEWVRDVFSEGTNLELQKLDANGVYKTYMVTRVVGKTSTYTFDELKSSTSYKIIATAYATLSDGTTILSDDSDVVEITEMASADVKVVSTTEGKAKVSWTGTGDVVLYYIYRADDSVSEGKVVAIIPASTGAYTNAKLTSGTTYYYHIDGYALVNDVLTKVNSSEHIPITVK